MTKLTDQELATVRGLVQEFNALKMQLADAYVHQQTIAKRIKETRIAYTEVENSLIQTYGANVSINIDTGEITPKEAELPTSPSMEVVK